MHIKRSHIRLKASAKRVVLCFLEVAANTENTERETRIINSVLDIPEMELAGIYEKIIDEFTHRHRSFETYLQLHFDKINTKIPKNNNISTIRQKVLAAYFTKEFSIQAAALFNPSIVVHPNQENLNSGEIRFIMSLRAVGENHISSVEFRSGIVDAYGNIKLDNISRFASIAIKQQDKNYLKTNLASKIAANPNFEGTILQEFPKSFTFLEYTAKLTTGQLSKYSKQEQQQLFDLLDANYDVKSSNNSSLSERVIFPSAQIESKGLEDVRFVQFKHAGTSTYIGTYTAYNGSQIRPQLLITNDFISFKIRAMYGAAASDKGMALFPEKINGQYALLSRQGGENISIMFSYNLYVWETYQELLIPSNHWDTIQIGNCGSPLKTAEGWLVITHAVGPLRTYAISAILLDLKQPSKILKKLEQPLLIPNEEEREGYVPNVVYSCGSLIHNDLLVLPYAMSDAATTFATVNIHDLLNEMTTTVVE